MAVGSSIHPRPGKLDTTIPDASTGAFNRPGFSEGRVGGVGFPIQAMIAKVLSSIDACLWRMNVGWVGWELDDGIIGDDGEEAAIRYFLCLGAIHSSSPQLAFADR